MYSLLNKVEQNLNLRNYRYIEKFNYYRAFIKLKYVNLKLLNSLI